MAIGAGRHDHRLQQLEAAPLAGLAAQALHRLALGRRCTARPARVLPGLPGQGSHAGQGTVLECLPAQLAAATGAHQQPQGAAAQQALDVQPRATALPGGALAATAQLAREAIEHALDIQAGTTLAPLPPWRPDWPPACCISCSRILLAFIVVSLRSLAEGMPC